MRWSADCRRCVKRCTRHEYVRRYRARLWDQVWNPHDAEAVDRFVVDDFVIVTGGETTTWRENFKKWIEGFLAKINDLHLEVVESFQNADGSRVASRWLLTNWVERATWEVYQRLTTA
jgi:SnoaL-like polyketide cyclase